MSGYGIRHCLLVLAGYWLALASSQSLQEGVDLVTRVSNDLMPSIYGAMADQRNLVIGAFGLTTNLAMLLEASSGKTRQEIMKVMNVTLDDVAALRVGFKAYCTLFLEHSSNPESAGTFTTVSLKSGFPVQSAFLSILNKHYCANVTTVNDANGSSFKLESHTGVMTHWKDFEKLAVYTFLSHQSVRPFLRRSGISSPAPMIPQVGVFRAGYWSNARVVLLPLETNLVDLLLIMPENSHEIDNYMKFLTNNGLSSVLNNLQVEDLELFIPQMTAVSKNQVLNRVLQTLGISLALDPEKADLTRAASDKTRRIILLGVSEDSYLTSSFTSFNAVSGAFSHLDLKTRRKREADKVYFNKPFLFLVLHKDTRLVLLAGKVEDPAQVPK